MAAMSTLHDEFLSEEDLDLRNLSVQELDRSWMLWLRQAQISNDLDEALQRPLPALSTDHQQNLTGPSA